jgi:hypothetical protein
MPTLRDYVTETEQWANTPREGDDLDIEIAPDELAEGVVIESDGEYIVLAVSESAVTALEQRGMLSERIGRYGAVGSSPGMGFTVAEQERSTMVSGELRMGKPVGPIQYNGRTVNPGDAGYAEASQALLRSHQRMQQARQQQRRDAFGTPGRSDSKPVYVDNFEESVSGSGTNLHEDYMSRMLELAGMARPMAETAPIQPNPNAARTDPLAAKAADLAPVGTEQDPTTATTVDEGVMSDIDMDLRHIAKTGREDALIDALSGRFGDKTADYLQNMLSEIEQELEARGQQSMIANQDRMMDIMMDRIQSQYDDDLEDEFTEAAAKPAKPAVKGAKPAAKGRDRSDLIPPNEIVSPPDGATAPGPGEPPHTNDAIEYNRRLGLPEQDTADDDRPLWQRAYDKVVATVKSASQSELDRRKADNRAAVRDAEREAGLHGTVNEAFDQRKADAYNRAVQAGHSPEQAEKIAGIRDEDQNYYEIDVDGRMKRLAVRAATAPGQVQEAEYQGRKVPLGKPMRGDVAKFKVYVRDPKTGNVKKVNFGHGGTSAKRAGQKTMRIKKSDPARRKSFRARHNCDNPGPRTKARYWSCRAW